MAARVAGRRRRGSRPVEAETPSGSPPARRRGWTRLKVAGAAAATLLGAASAAVGVQTWVGEKLEPPLTVTVEHRSNGSCNPGWVIPLPPEQLGEAPPVEAPGDPRSRWAADLGAVNAQSTIAEVTVQGTSERAIILTGITIDIVSRRAPVSGTHVAEACGDAFFARYFDVNLDADPPTVGPSVDQRVEVFLEGTEEPDTIDFPYTVDAGDPELFSLLARTGSCDCEWTATLHWRDGDSEGETAITEDGQPFRVTAATGPMYANYYGGRLEPQ
jgi:hypothetical protein